MSVSQQAGSEGSPSAATAASGTVEQQVETFLAAIRSGDGEGIAAALYRVLELEGAAGMATVGAALNGSALTDAMIAALKKRAEALRTPLAWLQLSDAAFAGSREAIAVEAAGCALKIDPASSNAALIVSGAANRRGDFDEALRVISALVARVPEEKDNPPFIIQTAVAEISRDQPTAALALIDAALPRLTAASLEFDALVLRARALGAITGRSSEAISAWEHALAVAQHPAQVGDVRDELMAALFQAERYDECLHQLDLEIAATSDLEERTASMKTRVNILVKKGDIDAALTAMDDLLAATTVPQERVDFRLQQAGILATAGRWKDTVVRFDAALTEVPTDANDASERRHAIQMQKAQTLVLHELDLVVTDLDELDTTWPTTSWPVPIDLRVSGLISAGRPAEALEWLEARVARTPALRDHPAVHQLRAEIEIKLGHTDEAMVECRCAVDLAATAADQRALGAVLMCAFGSQQWKAAVDAYDRLGQLDPAAASDQSLRIIAAFGYLRLNELQTALRLTEDAPPVPGVMLVMRDVCRGEALVRLTLYDDAVATTAEGIQHYQAAQAGVPPTLIPAEFLLSLQTLRAQAFNELGKFEDAREAATAAIEVPEQPGAAIPGLTKLVRLGAYMQRSLALYRLGRKIEAEKDIDTAIDGFELLRNSPAMKVIEQAPEFEGIEGALWHAKGAVLESESRSEEALAAYTRAEKLEKHGGSAAIARGYALSSTGAFTEATFAFDTALTRATSPKERAEAFAGKGRALVRLKKYEKAIASLQSALDARLTSPDDDPIVFEQLGIAYSSLQRNEAAKRAFNRAWTMTKEDKPSANLARGMTAADLRRGEPEVALQFLEKELSRELADDRTLLFNRALALDALGRRREAIRFLVRARDGGLDRAQLELDRLDAPAGLGRWTHYWFGAQANRTRRAFGIAFAFIALMGLAAPLLPWWLNGKLEWYLLLMPSVVALLLLALPNMKSIGFEGGGLSVSVEPLSATGRDAAAIAAPESFNVPTLAAVSVTTRETKLL